MPLCLSELLLLLRLVDVNHNGNLDTALELIKIAQEVEVDAVKFQAWSRGRFPEIEHLRLNKNALAYVQDYAWGHDLEWMCTAFDFESIDFLNNELKIKRWKIPSGMITNIPYLEKIRSINPEYVILSTGMSDLSEISTALDIIDPIPEYLLSDFPSVDITILHCVSLYPTKPEEVNLKCIKTLKKELVERVGYSDHSARVGIPIRAAGMGAEIIEVHITSDRNQKGPDHKASYEPNELKLMVTLIRDGDIAMGNGKKWPDSREIRIRDDIRERMKICAK